MAIIFQPKQRKDNGCWKMIEFSDEEKSVFHECCDCPDDAHKTAEEAKACPQVVALLEEEFPKPKKKETTQDKLKKLLGLEGCIVRIEPDDNAVMKVVLRIPARLNYTAEMEVVEPNTLDNVLDTLYHDELQRRNLI